MFKLVRPILRIALSLERIAKALEYFALKDAQVSGRFFNPKKARYLGDSSELLHTPDPAIVSEWRTEELDLISNRGFKYVDDLEAEDS